MEEERADGQAIDEPIELVIQQARDLEQSEREHQDPRPKANEQESEPMEDGQCDMDDQDDQQWDELFGHPGFHE